MIIRLPIDIKSLYLNIKNDNESGHTATVSTPLKQYGSVHEELLPIFDIPDNINKSSKEELIGSLLVKSRAEARIVKVCVFDKICVNGLSLKDVPSYCIYVREETAPTNVHCGRQKVHYPTTFKYSDADVEINNKLVMQAVSSALGDYAFIIEAFEYDTDAGVLNFDAIIVGPNSIPYSKVFVNKRGVGNKFSLSFNENSDTYDTEIISLRQNLGYEAVSPENFAEVVYKNYCSACDVVSDYLASINATGVRFLSNEYPYSLYDVEYSFDGKKNYIILMQTATKFKTFTLSINKIQFLNVFSAYASLILVTDIFGARNMNVYKIDNLNALSKTIKSINYEDRM